MSVQSILLRIEAELLRLEAVSRRLPSPEQVVRAKIRDNLSGAFGRKVMVKEGIDGGLFALIPAPVFKSSGLTIQRSVVPGAKPILVGEDTAVANAERRVAKRLGEGWIAHLAEYEPYNALAVFALDGPP